MPTILGNANAIVAVPLTIAGGGGPIKPVEFFILAENGDKCITEVGTNVPDSSFIPLQVVRVFATGTTCSEILALY